MIHMSLFSGIGGFELAAEWMGWNNLVSCEINDFGRKVLDYYWPNGYHHNDIHTLTYDKINEELTRRYGADWRSDDIILTGGFPCQPYSAAGKRLGNEDDRHLWPQMCRIIREVRPTWVVGENVFGLVNWNDGMVFNEVQADLEVEGYEVQPYVLPAASVGAPHRRDRVWFVAYSKRPRTWGDNGAIGNEGRRASKDRSESIRQAHGEVGSSGFDATSKNGITPDTEGLRDRRNPEAMGETQTEPIGKDDGNELDGSSKIAPDTDRDAEATSNPYISTKGSSRLGKRPHKKGSKNHDVEGEWGSAAEQYPRFDHVSSDASDPNGPRLQTQGAEQQTTGPFQHGELGEWDASDTMHKGLQRGSKANEWQKSDDKRGRNGSIIRASGSNSNGKSRCNFQDFPTQPPVRSRNDGLSSELVGITVSKHRNESIKAYGNAIVPQVAHQIFKAIQQYKDQQP